MYHYNIFILLIFSQEKAETDVKLMARMIVEYITNRAASIIFKDVELQERS